ncbi:MAG: hypothetical protein EOO42_01230 [Flavobacteriales bacterium]|nr:MAG: hypothetical protein EOO42_01230 [Flavobacteriales bacterium]
MGKYYLDGIDLESIGVYVESNASEFLKLPESKDLSEYDWTERTGVEVDLSAPLVFKKRDISVDLAIVRFSEAQFWSGYNALINILKAPGTHRLYIEELARSFFVYYNRMDDYKLLSKIKGQQLIGSKLKITFTEPVPSLLKPYAFLTMQGGGYLLTNSGQLINLNP